MPQDFEAEIVGVSVADEFELGKWHSIDVAGRNVRFLPVARLAGARRSGFVPTKAAIVAGMVRHRGRIAADGRVAQVHAPAMDLGLVGRHMPFVRVVHNAARDLSAGRGESSWQMLGPALHAFESSSFRRAARVYFVDRATLDAYAGGTPSDSGHLRFLPNGIDMNLFHPLSDVNRQAAREKLGRELDIQPDERWLVFAGRLDQQKDPELLLRSFAA